MKGWDNVFILALFVFILDNYTSLHNWFSNITAKMDSVH